MEKRIPDHLVDPRAQQVSQSPHKTAGAEVKNRPHLSQSPYRTCAQLFQAGDRRRMNRVIWLIFSHFEFAHPPVY
jgi:hypothetical protein